MPLYSDFYLHVVELYNIQPEPKTLRLGQIYFNKLNEIRPDIAKLIRGTPFDPFFKERITNVVHDRVISHW